MQRFIQRGIGSLLVPLLAWPVALLLLSAAQLTGFGLPYVAGQWVVVTGMPLLFALGVAAGFTEGAPAALVGAGLAFGVGVALTGQNPSVLYGLLMGAVGALVYQGGRRLRLPEWVGMFTGERLAPILATLAALPVSLLWARVEPLLNLGLGAVDAGLAHLGPWGAGLYALGVRLLVPTGLHHLLTLLVDYELGSYTAGGQVVHGQLLRYLLGDPTAGWITGSFILTLGFCVPAMGLALWHGARSEWRAQVGPRLGMQMLTSVVVGTSEGIELALQPSPVLRWLHVLLSGAVGWSTYALGVRAHGYTLLVGVLGVPLMQGPLRLLLLGLVWGMVYYVAVRLVLAWQRPAVVGQVAPIEVQALEAPPDWLQALGGEANVLAVDACMTRLRVTVRDPGSVDQRALQAAGQGLVLQGQQVQVVLGGRAAALRDALHRLLGQTGPGLLLAPCGGPVVPLAQVPDAAFAQGLLGSGVAVDCRDAQVCSPTAGTVAALFPGGHAIGIRTPEGAEVLVHIGLETSRLGGDGFTPLVAAGDAVTAGQPLVRLDRARLLGHGVSLLTPVVVTNAADLGGVETVAAGAVRAGEPLLRINLRGSE